MGSDNPQDGNNRSDRSDETLTPKTAYRLTEEQGMTQTEVGDMFDVSQPRVSTLVSQYQDAREEGKDEVDPTDFEREELESALGDKEPDENPFEGTTCPRCDSDILKGEAPDSAGVHDCPHCNEPIQWNEEELP